MQHVLFMTGFIFFNCFVNDRLAMATRCCFFFFFILLPFYFALLLPELRQNF